MLRDPPRERRPDALDFGREIALDRGGSRRANRLEIEHPELLAVARMLLGMAVGADARADFDPGEIADHGNAPAQAAGVFAFDDRDRVSARFVHIEHVIERPLDRLGSLLLFTHPARGSRAWAVA